MEVLRMLMRGHHDEAVLGAPPVHLIPQDSPGVVVQAEERFVEHDYLEPAERADDEPQFAFRA